MKRTYDVAVIGAGPIGSYTAYQMADKGFDVALFDAKKKIGSNVICAGVLSKEAFKRYDLPSDSILSRINTATFVSPNGKQLVYRPKDIFCYVIDRRAFDHGLYKQAASVGCDVFLHHQVTSVREAKQHYTVVSRRRSFRRKYIEYSC